MGGPNEDKSLGLVQAQAQAHPPPADFVSDRQSRTISQ
jgi:hypothetical protein